MESNKFFFSWLTWKYLLLMYEFPWFFRENHGDGQFELEADAF